MGLLGRIFQSLYLTGLMLIEVCLTNEPDEKPLTALAATLFKFLVVFGGLFLILSVLVWAMSFPWFLTALIFAYLSAWLWSKLSARLTILVREIYLISSTIGYTVLMGAVIQIDRLPQAGSITLGFYWIFLSLFGFLLWRITVGQVMELSGNTPGVKIRKIEYKKHFRFTQIPKEIPTLDQVQAYLKKIK